MVIRSSGASNGSTTETISDTRSSTYSPPSRTSMLCISNNVNAATTPLLPPRSRRSNSILSNSANWIVVTIPAASRWR